MGGDYLEIDKKTAINRTLTEAILLFFEDRDAIAIHILSASALRSLHEHFDSTEIIKDRKLFLHYKSETDPNKLYLQYVWDAHNFFKHSKKDIKNGVSTIDFSEDVNQLYLYEAINIYKYIYKEMPPIFFYFLLWFSVNEPQFTNNKESLADINQVCGPDVKNVIELLQSTHSAKSHYLELIRKN